MAPFLSLALNLPLAQNNTERFVASWTVEKSNLKLHLLALFVRSTSHCPFLFWRAYFSSAFWTFSHNVSSIMTGYVGLMFNE